MAAAATNASIPSPAAVGRRLLGEIEETTLEDVLKRIRTEGDARAQQAAAAAANGPPLGATQQQQPGAAATATGIGTQAAPVTTAPRVPHLLPSFPVPALQRVVASHFRATRAPELVVAGARPLALVYLVVAALVAAPRRQAVVVVDTEGRFDSRQLLGVRPMMLHQGATNPDADPQEEELLTAAPVSADDLAHVHVLRADPRWRAASLAQLVAVAEQRVLYGGGGNGGPRQRARDRPWWGTLVIGGGATRTGGEEGGGGGGGPALGGPSAAAAPALVTGYYGWLRVEALDPDPQQARDAQQRRLRAALENGETDDPEDEPPPGDASARVPLTWVANSPWGSFVFRLRITEGL